MRHAMRLGAIISLVAIGYSSSMLAQTGGSSVVIKPAVPLLLEKMGHRVAVETKSSKGVHHFRLSWKSTNDRSSIPSTNQIQFLEQIDRKQQPPRQRSSEISRDHLVVIVLDQPGTVRYWRIIADPRLVRGEFPGKDGNLQNHSFYRPDVTLDVPVPDTVDAAEIQILSPSWDRTGTLQLSPISVVKLPASPQR